MSDGRVFKTSKGTELPFLLLPQRKKNKKTGQWEDVPPAPYLTVQHRIVWFREEHPDWSIETELKPFEGGSYAKATIKDVSGRVISVGHKVETASSFSDYYEKSESSAVGRALAFLGYGTAYALELEEGDRLADTPISEPLTGPQASPLTNNQSTKMERLECEACGDTLKLNKNGDKYYCPNGFKTKEKGHTYVAKGEEWQHLRKMEEWAKAQNLGSGYEEAKNFKPGIDPDEEVPF